MLLSLTGNSKPIKKQVAINKMSKDNSKDIAKIGNYMLDGSYFNKNKKSKAKGTAIENNENSKDASWLIIDDFNKV